MVIHCIHLYTAIRMQGQFNGYPVLNDTLRNHLYISYHDSSNVHRYAYELSVHCIPGHKRYLLKALLHKQEMLLCIRNVTSMHTQSSMIPVETTFPSDDKSFSLHPFAYGYHCALSAQWIVGYPVINDTLRNQLHISYQYPYNLFTIYPY